MKVSGVTVKVCGLTDSQGVLAAIEGGARFIGFVFYPPSPRSVTPLHARELSLQLPQSVSSVGVFFEPGDAELDSVVGSIPNVLVQLHGQETPRRVAEIKSRFKVRIIKSISVATSQDIESATNYEDVADWLLFDAKAPKEQTNALPGGNALAFDWKLLGGKDWKVPWLLSGGLTADNLRAAVSSTRARAVDVSSGVEDVPGQKSPERIREFLAVAGAI